ncbi:MAG TPA: chitinase [Terriglobales bacterium]
MKIQRTVVLLSLAFAVFCQAQTTPTPAAKPEPIIFAPYVDISKSNGNIPQLMAASGVKHVTVAFVQSQGCAPLWINNTLVSADNLIADYIKKVRAAGGDVIIAFGGWDGTDIGQACPDVKSLQTAYQTVIDKYKVTMLDFDIEHFAIEDAASIDRRSQALTALSTANPGLKIHYTLPASPRGLTPQSMNVIASAVKYGTPVAIVNLMTMDYGAPVPNGSMGVQAVAASGAALVQLKAAGLNARIGITPMIGANDTPGETFTLGDAQAVLAYAQANRDVVALLSFWALGRDNGTCSATVNHMCSGISQEEFAFSRIFLQAQ